MSAVQKHNIEQNISNAEVAGQEVAPVARAWRRYLENLPKNSRNCCGCLAWLFPSTKSGREEVEQLIQMTATPAVTSMYGSKF